MKVQLLDIVLIILFFQLLTAVPFLLFKKTNRSISNRILGLLLISKALCISNFVAFRLYPYTFEFFPHLFYTGSSFTILWGPLLYLYVTSLTVNGFKFSVNHSVHFIPFLVHFLFVTFSFQIYAAEAKRTIMEGGGIFSPAINTLYPWVLYTYIAGYALTSILVIINYRGTIKNNYSSLKSINLNWIVFIVIGVLLKVGLDMWYTLAEYGSPASNVAIISSRLVLFLFINIMIFKGLKQPVIWLGEEVAANNRNMPLSEAYQEKYLDKLLSYTHEFKPYLNPDITMEELAMLVDIPPRSLSWILNERLDQSFYNFINSYRIKESVALFCAKNSENKTILEVLYEVGFNSKSSFNTAFKKFTGLTPTQYRKLHPVPVN